MFKVIVPLFLACSVNAAPADDAENLAYQKKIANVLISLNETCIEEVGMPIFEDKVPDDFNPLEMSQVNKCYATCFLEKLGEYKDNKYIPEAVFAQVPPNIMEGANKAANDKLKEAMLYCEKTINENPPEDKCDMGPVVLDCIKKKAAVLGFPPYAVFE